MNNIEEKLWDYIDGNCSAAEQEAISGLIDSDEVYRDKYQELLLLNQEFATMELDEPPMAFTYNVMEAIRTEQAQVPLKAAINKRLMFAIGAFFVLTILALLIFTFSNVSLSATDVTASAPKDLKMPDINHYISKPIVEGFVFFDIVLALYLLDGYLRKKNLSKQV
ncbi:anti-sigma factor family protein [Mucilaginibacter sp.]|uniref:anti-sigma factor family protein n=1 Tax=Mucilaginibacter sp. TaxID=1882438 RepID=UPI003D0B45BA